jgi:hypothetical protein
MRRAFASAAFAFALLFVAGCGGPKTPDSVSAAEADAGELTCAERARARSICQNALRLRCQSRASDCESVCRQSESSKNFVDTAPVYSGEQTSTCVENCRGARDRCVRDVVIHCPGPCAPKESLSPQGPLE